MAITTSLHPEFVRPLVLSGPSGVGKSTLLTRLFKEFPDKFGFSVSHTTRAPRPGEVDGKHYHFVTRETFEKHLNTGNFFIEHAEFSGNLYGTSFDTVRAVGEQGKRCILDIEAQGVKQIKKTDLNPVYLFISPPSMAALRDRLKGRGTESEESIRKRLQMAIREVNYAKGENSEDGKVHDIVIVNKEGDVEGTYEKFKRVALGERIEGDEMPPLDD